MNEKALNTYKRLNLIMNIQSCKRLKLRNEKNPRCTKKKNFTMIFVFENCLSFFVYCFLKFIYPLHWGFFLKKNFDTYVPSNLECI